MGNSSNQDYTQQAQPNQQYTQQDEQKSYASIPIGLITYKNHSDAAHGSRVMLSRNIILTSAHNLFDRYNHEIDKSHLRFYIGTQRNQETQFEVEDWKYPSMFSKSQSAKDKIQFDYALIKLKQSLQYDSFPSISLPCQNCLLQKYPKYPIKIDIFDYPDQQQTNKQQGRYEPLKIKKYHSIIQSKMVDIEPENSIIKFRMNKAPKESGYPIFVNTQIVAIHISTQGSTNSLYFGRLFTQEMITNLIRWRQQLEGHYFTIKRCSHQKSEGPTQRQIKISEALDFQKNGMKDQNQHNYVLALKKYYRALQIMEDIYGPKSTQAAIIFSRIGKVYYLQGNYEKALENYFRSLQIYQKTKGEESIEQATTLDTIGAIFDSMGNYPMALEYYYISLSIAQKIKGKRCFESASILNNIAMVYDSQGNYQKALEYYFQSLQIKERVKGKGCIESADTLNNVGLVYKNQGNYPKALEFYTLALQINERVHGKGCMDSAILLNNIGSIYDNKGNYAKALEFYMLSLQIHERIKGQGCIDSATTLNNIGTVYKAQKNYQKAVEYYQLSLQIKQRVKGQGCIDSASTLQNIGLVYKAQGDQQKALQYFTLSLEIKQRVKGKNCIDLTTTLNYIGSVYDTKANYEKAIEYYKRAASIFQSLEVKYQGYAITQLNLANAYKKSYQSSNNQGSPQKLNDYESTAEAFRKALLTYKEINKGKTTKIMMSKLGQLQKQLNRQKEELELAQT